MESHQNLEIRSRKVRTIIGKIPHLILRVGTFVLTFIFIIFILVSYYYKFGIVVQMDSIIKCGKDSCSVTIYVPLKYKDNINTGSLVKIPLIKDHTVEDYYLSFEIDNTPKGIVITSNGAFYLYETEIANFKMKNYLNIPLNIDENTKLRARVFTSKMSLVERIFSE